MKYFLILFLVIPLCSSAQPFSVKKKQMRFIEVNSYKYYDIHIVLNSKKSSSEYLIDSLCVNNSYSIHYKLSVLGKDITTTNYEKGDSVLLQITVPFDKMKENENTLKLYYHNKKSKQKSKLFIINTIQLLDSIKFEHNQ